MSWAIASCSAEIAQAFPQILVKTLKNHTDGKDYIIELDPQLRGLK